MDKIALLKQTSAAQSVSSNFSVKQLGKKDTRSPNEKLVDDAVEAVAFRIEQKAGLEIDKSVKKHINILKDLDRGAVNKRLENIINKSVSLQGTPAYYAIEAAQKLKSNLNSSRG